MGLLSSYFLSNFKTNFKKKCKIRLEKKSSNKDYYLYNHYFKTKKWYLGLAEFLHIKSRCQNPKYENGFKHLWHLASGQAMNTNDENV